MAGVASVGSPAGLDRRANAAPLSVSELPGPTSEARLLAELTPLSTSLRGLAADTVKMELELSVKGSGLVVDAGRMLEEQGGGQNGAIGPGRGLPPNDRFASETPPDVYEGGVGLAGRPPRAGKDQDRRTGNFPAPFFSVVDLLVPAEPVLPCRLGEVSRVFSRRLTDRVFHLPFARWCCSPNPAPSVARPSRSAAS